MNNDILKKKYGKVRDIIYSPAYLKGIKTLTKAHKKKELKKIKEIIDKLVVFDIDTQYHNHLLNDGKTYELHVVGDILLTYRYDAANLYIDLNLTNLTDHKNLNKKLNSSLESVDEDIEKHDTLNPKLFDGDELKSEVKDAIQKIVDQFISELKEDGVKFNIKDVVLVGSNVSYNYTKDSDLDIHIIADSEGLECPDDLYPLLYSAYRSIFNKNYDISIKGIPAEIYVEMDKPAGISNGIYSLNTGWVKVPEPKEIPDIDYDAFNDKFKEWEDKYHQLIGEEVLNEEVKEADVPSQKLVDECINFIVDEIESNLYEIDADGNAFSISRMTTMPMAPGKLRSKKAQKLAMAKAAFELCNSYDDLYIYSTDNGFYAPKDLILIKSSSKEDPLKDYVEWWNAHGNPDMPLDIKDFKKLNPKDYLGDEDEY